MKANGFDTCDVLLKIAFHLCNGGQVSTQWIRDTYGVSKATAKRYMVRIEVSLPVIASRSEIGARVIRLGATA